MSFVEQSVIIKKISFSKISNQNFLFQIILTLFLVIFTFLMDETTKADFFIAYYGYFALSALFVISVFLSRFKPLQLKNIGPKVRKYYFTSFFLYIFLFGFYYIGYKKVRPLHWKPKISVYDRGQSMGLLIESKNSVKNGVIFFHLIHKQKKIKNKSECYLNKLEISLSKFKNNLGDKRLEFYILNDKKLHLGRHKFNLDGQIVSCK